MRIAAGLLVGLALLAGCSNVDIAQPDTTVAQPPGGQGPTVENEQPDALALAEPVELDMVFAAIDQLRVAQAVTVSWTELSAPAPPPPGAPEGPFRTTVLLTTDPERTTTFIALDNTDVGELWEFELDRRATEGAIDQESAEMTEVLMSWAATATMRVGYYTIEDSEKLNVVRVSDFIEFADLRMQNIHQVWGLQADELPDLERLELPDFTDHWLTYQYNEEEMFPGGPRWRTSSEASATILRLAGAWDDPALADFELSELSRTEEQVCVSLHNIKRNRSVELCLDPALTIVSLQSGSEQVRQSASFDWNPDLSVLDLPDQSLLITTSDLSEATKHYQWLLGAVETIEPSTTVVSTAAASTSNSTPTAATKPPDAGD